MPFNSDRLSWRGWSRIMLCKPEVAQYDRNKERSSYHQRPSGCWIKMLPVGITGIPCRLIVPPQGECVLACVSFLYPNKVDTGVSSIFCSSEKDTFHEYKLDPTEWYCRRQDEKTGQMWQRWTCFTSWTRINVQCVWTECVSRPVFLSLSCVHIAFLFLTHMHTHFVRLSLFYEVLVLVEVQFVNKRPD